MIFCYVMHMIQIFSARMLKIQTRYMFCQRIFMILQKNQSQLTFQFSTLIFERSRKVLKVSLSSLDFTYSIICFSQVQCDDLDKFIYDLPNYTSSHQKRSDNKSGGVSVYIHNSLNLKTKPDLSTNCGDIESLALVVKHVTLQ